MKYCRNCGCELLDSDNFCPKCGTNQNSGAKAEPAPLAQPVANTIQTGIIISRDRRKWQGYVSMGAGILSVVLLPILLFWTGSFFISLSTIPFGVVFSILSLVDAFSIFGCFATYKARLKNSKIKAECMFRDADGITIVDLNKKQYHSSIEELMKNNKNVLGNRGVLYVQLPVEGGKIQEIFCGYCTEELDLEEYLKENPCH